MTTDGLQAWNEADLERLVSNLLQALDMNEAQAEKSARLFTRLHRNVALGAAVPSVTEIANLWEALE